MNNQQVTTDANANNGRVKIELPFSGFYESIHDSQIDGAIENCFSDDHGDVTPEAADAIYMADVDWAAIQTEYSEKYTEALADELNLDLEFDGMTSPQYYNFSTDRIFAMAPADQMAALRDAVYKHEKWPEYIKDNYTSYDGFLSFYEADINHEHWTREELDECQWRSVISFWIHNIYTGSDDLEYNLIDYINVYEFDTIQDAADVIQKYIDDNRDPETPEPPAADDPNQLKLI